MLRVRVIPVVLLDGFSVVKTIKFDVRRNLGNPIAVARIYNTRNVDELVLLDIDASRQGRSIDLITVQEVAKECFMPLSVGGGIRSTKDITAVLKRGADKVVLNTIALEEPNFIRESSNMFGSQCIVVSVDIVLIDGKYQIYSHLQNERTTLDPLEWFKTICALGAGEIFVNFVSKDGTFEGPDTEYLSEILRVVSVPLICCGGLGTPADLVTVAKLGASGIAASSIFHFTGFTPQDCKLEMRNHQIPVRL